MIHNDLRALLNTAIPIQILPEIRMPVCLISRRGLRSRRLPFLCASFGVMVCSLRLFYRNFCKSRPGMAHSIPQPSPPPRLCPGLVSGKWPDVERSIPSRARPNQEFTATRLTNPSNLHPKGGSRRGRVGIVLHDLPVHKFWGQRSRYHSDSTRYVTPRRISNR